MQTTSSLKRTAILLLWLTIAWNTFEGISSIYLGIQAQSLALVAYGLGSGVEIFTSFIVLMELGHIFKQKIEEKRALRAIGIAYIIVGIYICIEAINNLMVHQTADTSYGGILLMVASTGVMLVLGVIKHMTGKKLKSTTIMADAKFTLMDGGLSLSVLFGLVLTLIFPIWWIDQVLALLIAGVAFKEGFEEIRN